MPKLAALGAVGAAVLLAACSSGGDATPTEAASSSVAPTSSSATAAPSPSGSPIPSATEEAIVATLCDKATPEQVKIIEKSLKPDFTVTNLVDVREDEEGQHAIMGFVEGPGLSVLAVWSGEGLELSDLASADEYAETASKAPKGKADEDLVVLQSSTLQCYQTLYMASS